MITLKQKLMKKALFVLLITTIALTGFRKSDALVVSFKNDNSKAIDLSKKNTSTAPWSVTTDTTKKGSGGRGDIITYRGTGKENVPVVGKGENTKKGGGGRGDIITYRGAGTEAAPVGKGETPKKETGGNGGVGKETKDNNKTEAVIFRQQKNK